MTSEQLEIIVAKIYVESNSNISLIDFARRLLIEVTKHQEPVAWEHPLGGKVMHRKVYDEQPKWAKEMWDRGHRLYKALELK